MIVIGIGTNDRFVRIKHAIFRGKELVVGEQGLGPETCVSEIDQAGQSGIVIRFRVHLVVNLQRMP